MSRLLIALTIWFLCLIAGVMLAAWLHNKDQQQIDWEPGFIATAREKITNLYEKLRATINKMKLSTLLKKSKRKAKR